LRRPPGVATTLQVLPAPDGDQTWLVQPGFDDSPTLVELVNVVEFRLARLMTVEVAGSWRPAGATVEGLVLVTDQPEPATTLVSPDGTVAAELDGTALSVGWNGAAILRPDGSLTVTDARLGDPTRVDRPGEGEWTSAGRFALPGTSPQTNAGSSQFLVMLAGERDDGTPHVGELIVVDTAGLARPIYESARGGHLAAWLAGDEWAVVVEDASVTLVSLVDGSRTPLGALIPESHQVLTAG
jgi:hypothetical protein